MKKLTFMASMAIAAATMVSCGGSHTPSANLKTDIDSLSYAEGISVGQNFNMNNVLQQLDVDSAYVDEFVKGVCEAVNASNDKKTAAYYAGLNIGSQLSEGFLARLNDQYFAADSTKTLSKDNFLAAFLDMVQGKDPKMDLMAADSVRRTLQDRIMEEQFAKQFAENKQKGEDFLAENAKNDSVQTTPSGLQYKILTKGEGAVPVDSSTVRVDYEGRLIDGTVFDSSFERGQSVDFPIQGGLIKGWVEALKLMPVGSEWELYIPQDLAYGFRGQGQMIPPYSTLIFRVKLLDIVNK